MGRVSLLARGSTGRCDLQEIFVLPAVDHSSGSGCRGYSRESASGDDSSAYADVGGHTCFSPLWVAELSFASFGRSNGCFTHPTLLPAPSRHEGWEDETMEYGLISR